MTSSQISVSNRALAQAGTRVQIANFNEGSVEAGYCSLLYAPTFEQLARTARWGCLRFQTALTLLKAAQGTPENQSGTTLPVPPQPWLYEYLLPPDCLRVRFLQPTFVNPPAGTVPIFPTPSSVTATVMPRTEIPYVVAQDLVNGQMTRVILTNLSMAQIIYNKNNQNPAFWDSQFEAGYVAALAAFLIPPLNLNLALLNAQTKITDSIIAEARSTDGNESVTSQNREASWIVARGAGEYIGSDAYGCGYASGYGGGYQEWGQLGGMIWPGG